MLLCAGSWSRIQDRSMKGKKAPCPSCSREIGMSHGTLMAHYPEAREMSKPKTRTDEYGVRTEVYVPRGWHPIVYSDGRRFTTCCDCNCLIRAEEGPRCGGCRLVKNKAKIARRQAKRIGLADVQATC